MPEGSGFQYSTVSGIVCGVFDGWPGSLKTTSECVARITEFELPRKVVFIKILRP